MNIEKHPLLPFIPKNAKVLMLGSFPPPKSRWKMDFYYPNFNNDMWRIMGLVFFGDKECFIGVSNKCFYQDKIEDFLREQGIAIFDAAKAVIREQGNASDKFLTVIESSDVPELLVQMPECAHIITTGEKATEILLSAHDLNPPKIGESVQLPINDKIVTLHRLPSSSRAYPLALDKKAAYYHAVFDEIFDLDEDFLD
ncbi:uracil-DNA glycosylase family protein [Moraxella sp.]|uniref:uracil-DNA glycosylase family protein n=1 Tax=Moraxella sp. TaxID=479 RepID=UPI002615E5C7|nr:uracil-DNA glycosylase family protein [Moraxella sp.]MCP3897199.1 uracil-DNA glycosylase family protein [Moraxella sp.]